MTETPKHGEASNNEISGDEIDLVMKFFNFPTPERAREYLVKNPDQAHLIHFALIYKREPEGTPVIQATQVPSETILPEDDAPEAQIM